MIVSFWSPTEGPGRLARAATRDEVRCIGTQLHCEKSEKSLYTYPFVRSSQTGERKLVGTDPWRLPTGGRCYLGYPGPLLGGHNRLGGHSRRVTALESGRFWSFFSSIGIMAPMAALLALALGLRVSPTASAMPAIGKSSVSVSGADLWIFLHFQCILQFSGMFSPMF